MTREEFINRFKGRMLLFLTEAWSCRKACPTDLGLLMDSHANTLRALLLEMAEAAGLPQQQPDTIPIRKAT